MTDSLGHHGCLLFLILETVLLFVLVTAINVYVSGFNDYDLVLFKSSLHGVLAKFPVDVTPPDWVFILWAATWLYLFIWMMYSITLLFRKPGDGKGYLYFRPPFVPLSVYISFNLSLLAQIGWIFLWTLEELRWSALTLLAVIVFAIVTMILAIRGLHFYADDLHRLRNGADVRGDHVIVQNSLGMYVAGTTMLTIINLAVALVYEWNMDQVDATTVALSTMGGVILIYFILDIVVFTADMCCLLAPYVVFTVVASGIMTKSFSGGDRNFLIALFLIGLAGFTTLFKLASMLYHACKKDHEEDEAKKKLLSNTSDDEDGSFDEDEDLQSNDKETKKYIKQAQLLLKAK
ncbi:hypothetical protein LSH36_42g08022 [Paralvinella palmiformis]|uniref:Uncharacterized protein n=1 Tax=Paralvinella palmiformis TaxID=53620 RepID=A0AAD9K6V6_9ANNE|nr:hypothetical protein LSH36_42g08022 [Paralvinella palmiformis]